MLYLILAVFGVVLWFLAAEITSLRSRIYRLEQKSNEKVDELSSEGTKQPPSAAGEIYRTVVLEKAELQPEKTVEHGQEKQEVPESQPVAASLASPPMPEQEPQPAQSVQSAQPEKRTSQPVGFSKTKVTEPAGSSSQVSELVEKATGYVKDFFTTGNVVTKIGVIVLFFGVAFLLKYAAQRDMLPIEFRFIGVFLAGLVILAVGLRLRKRELMYGLLLQGCGVGTLYLTIFAATKYYQLLPYEIAYPVMLVLVVLTGYLAVWQDAKYMAVFGIAGGFLAPVLMSTGGGSHVFLFSYYALLNFGITGIAWYRSWRELNLLGFFFTFIIATVWGFSFYQPKYFATTEPFLILFFLFYVLISILFSFRQPPNLRGFVDGFLVFGVPVVGFGLQYLLVFDYKYGLAISAAVLGLFYALVAFLLWRRRLPEMKVITEAFIGLSFVFATLSVPLGLDGWWTAAVWAVEGCAVLWVGLQQNRLLPRLSGTALQFASGASFLIDYSRVIMDTPVVNAYFMGCLLICLAGLFTCYCLNRKVEKLYDFEKYIILPMLVWGLLWWFGSAWHEIDKFVSNKNSALFILLHLAFTYVLMRLVASRLSWEHLRGTISFVLPIVTVIGGVHFIDHNPLYSADRAIFNIVFVGGLLLSLAGFCTSYYLNFLSSLKQNWEKIICWMMLIWGAVWWYLTGINEIDRFMPSVDNFAASIVFISLSSLLMGFAGRKLTWNHLSQTSMLILPFMVLFCVLAIADYRTKHLFAGFIGISWVVAFACLYWILYSSEKVWPEKVVPFYHLGSWLLLIFICTWESIYWVEIFFKNQETWLIAGYAMVPLVFSITMLKYGEHLRWPVERFKGTYMQLGLLIPIGYLVLWLCAVIPYHGDPDPLPYLPLLNPIELLQLTIAILLVSWIRSEHQWLADLGVDLESRHLRIIAGVAAFLLFNVAVARSVHFWAGVSFTISGLFNSLLFQATLSIIWGVMALIVTFVATKKGSRVVWIAGALILTLVVAKLFLVDLAGTGTVSRIVSFLGVGALMLLIGYLSPLPPSQERE